jgi:phospholipid/cholesterol/gamma-HCH transport system permease protein
MSAEAGWIEAKTERDMLNVSAGGHWGLAHMEALLGAARQAVPEGAAAKGGRARIDIGKVTYLDPSGAWLLLDIQSRLKIAGIEAEIVEGRAADRALIERVSKAVAKAKGVTPEKVPPAWLAAIGGVGKTVVDGLAKGRELLGFFGLTVVLFGRALLRPWRVQWKATIKHIELTGFNALPIVGLLAFLIGLVVAFMGAVQLKRFGAEIFTVNLVGVAVLRELGVLITSILIAGRSGSAFTAQIGTMKVNQEVDAMQTIGINPVEVLVLPRLMAMMISLPLLTFYADIMGLTGGALMSVMTLDITLDAFLTQLKSAVDVDTFLIGFLKAPVFAYVIAMVGCYEGLQVSGSAESVGQRTTMSVVEAIFLVIAIDAIVAITLSALNI